MLVQCQRSASNYDNHPVIIMPPRVWLQELVSFTYSKDWQGSLDEKVPVQHFQRYSMCLKGINYNLTLDLPYVTITIPESEYFQILLHRT